MTRKQTEGVAAGGQMMMSSLRLRVLKILTELVSELVLANKRMQIDRVKRELKEKVGVS